MLNETAMKIYQYIKTAIENEYPPTVREICNALDIKSTATVHKYINLLTDEGYIEKSDNHNRAIRLKNTDNIINVPVIEKIVSGTDLTSYENIICHICFSSENNYKYPLFALKMKDDSMISAGIHKGDIIIAEQSGCAEEGDIIAAISDDETPIITAFSKKIRDNTEILGKVVALQRFF